MLSSGPASLSSGHVALEPGDTAPLFSQKGVGRDFNLANLGGSPVALAFFPSSALGVGKAMLERLAPFDGKAAVLVALSADPADAGRLHDRPGFHAVLDLDGKAARLYGAIPFELVSGARVQFRPRLILLDRRLRVAANLELKPDGSDAERLDGVIAMLAGPGEPDLDPPLLVVPQVFPDEFCDRLVRRFEESGGVESGVVAQTGGTTGVILDPGFKRRRDVRIEDAATIAQIKAMLKRRLVPQIAKAFQFQASHVERHIISRYSAEEDGHFRAHRDNHALGTAHRRFAATINLNSDYDGGTLSFPEFGARGFKAPKGGAIVFSCSLLHAVSPMTRGLRYAYLPFFYDEAAARLLEANRASWTEGTAPAGPQTTRL